MTTTTLFDKLGGLDTVSAVVEEMYERLVRDVSMACFFENISMVQLKYHQVQFMKIAFTEIPDDLDVPKHLDERHKKLFEQGLNETHFDKVAQHFVGACHHVGVVQELVDEAVAIILPLRAVFEQGAVVWKMQPIAPLHMYW
jgi:hemoglobin